MLPLDKPHRECWKLCVYGSLEINNGAKHPRGAAANLQRRSRVHCIQPNKRATQQSLVHCLGTEIVTACELTVRHVDAVPCVTVAWRTPLHKRQRVPLFTRRMVSMLKLKACKLIRIA